MRSIVTIDTGASVTIDRPDITVGFLFRKPNRPQALQTAFMESLAVWKEELVKLTLRRKAQLLWMFIVKITREFILGVNILQAYDTMLH
jgi:hypothetical protein